MCLHLFNLMIANCTKWQGLWVCHVHCYNLYPPSPFIVVISPKSWYSFYRPTEGKKLSWHSAVRASSLSQGLYISMFTGNKVVIYRHICEIVWCYVNRYDRTNIWDKATPVRCVCEQPECHYAVGSTEGHSQSELSRPREIWQTEQYPVCIWFYRNHVECVQKKSNPLVFSVRCNIYISCLCYDVHLSVTEVHWRIS